MVIRKEEFYSLAYVQDERKEGGQLATGVSMSVPGPV